MNTSFAQTHVAKSPNSAQETATRQTPCEVRKVQGFHDQERVELVPQKVVWGVIRDRL